MEKKILLAVDGSVHSRNAVCYAVQMASIIRDLGFTLFHVQPIVSQFLWDDAETNPKAKCALKKIMKANAEDAQRILEGHKARMVGMGIPEKDIELVAQPRILGLAKDVIECARQGLYDAVVVGRRGLSRLQEAFMGSLANNLVEHATAVPLWVVDGEVTSDKIMLAVDGSEASLRAVDHLSFMFGKNPDIRVTLFHVTPRVGDYCRIDFDDRQAGMDTIISESAKRCIDGFYAQALKVFDKAGIGEKQIEIKTARATVKVGKAIIDEAKKGDYGTVVIGRRGANKAFFMGSVSRHVIDKTSGKALWVIN